MKYYTIEEFAELIGKTSQTLREWGKKDLFKPHHIAPTGYRYYSQEQLNHFLSISGIKVKNRRIIGYYRASSSKQKEDDEGVVRE